ncbi:DUF3370 domain-containing protein [Synechocystis salina LEGE 06099]|uniref:DUF3370 domain-containing protein n=1 Tax=Synechocystis salina TaxID=945780 RepID=UPI00188045B9|nr:DUF3370 domain-containing protein [Synechocystis salina]MBE9203081.1 DUF3370 domain-containing protein [Synechocystis salina LEGE 06099]
MIPLLSPMMLAQIVTAPIQPIQADYIVQPQEIRPLPGQLDQIPVFNSNSPEVIEGEGILLSTFPTDRKYYPNAHLNKALNGRFDFFSHHIARPRDSRTLYQGVLVGNPTDRTITVRILQGGSYLTGSDAPFINLAPTVEDPHGEFYSGPGSKLMSQLLRGNTQSGFPSQIIIPPGHTRLLFSLAINRSSARSTYLRLQSDGPVYMANLAMFAVPEYAPVVDTASAGANLPTPTVTYRPPTLDNWQAMLYRGYLAYPRDLAPTPPDQIRPGAPRTPIYGRVAGISQGASWQATLVDNPKAQFLSIPQRGRAFSYPLSTVSVGTYATQQVQSAPMLARYPDTAYLAHGNYGVHYQLQLPLKNITNSRQSVSLTLQTPIKQDQYNDRLFFIRQPTGQVFFRGTVRVSYTDSQNQPQERFFHLTQRRGEMSNPLITLNMEPGEQRQVTVDLMYPPDATPPQVLTVKTEELYYGSLSSPR